MLRISQKPLRLQRYYFFLTYASPRAIFFDFSFGFFLPSYLLVAYWLPPGRNRCSMVAEWMLNGSSMVAPYDIITLTRFNFLVGEAALEEEAEAFVGRIGAAGGDEGAEVGCIGFLVDRIQSVADGRLG